MHHRLPTYCAHHRVLAYAPCSLPPALCPLHCAPRPPPPAPCLPLLILLKYSN